MIPGVWVWIEFDWSEEIGILNWCSISAEFECLICRVLLNFCLVSAFLAV